MKFSTRYLLNDELVAEVDTRWYFRVSWFNRFHSRIAIDEEADYLSPEQVNDKIRKAIAAVGGEQSRIGNILHSLLKNRGSCHQQEQLLKSFMPGVVGDLSDAIQFDYSSRDACDGLVLSMLLPLKYYPKSSELFLTVGLILSTFMIYTERDVFPRRPNPFPFTTSIIALGAIVPILRGVRVLMEPEFDRNSIFGLLSLLLEGLLILSRESVQDYFNPTYIQRYGLTPRGVFTRYPTTEAVVMVMQEYPRKAEVILRCCQLLQGLHWDDDKLAVDVRKRVLVLVLGGLLDAIETFHDNPEIVKIAFFLIHVIVSKVPSLRHLVEPRRVLHLLIPHINDGDIVSRGLAIVKFLIPNLHAASGTENLKENDNLLLDIIMYAKECIERRSLDHCVQIKGFETINEALVSRNWDKEVLVSHRILQVAMLALSNENAERLSKQTTQYAESQDVMERACLTLVILGMANKQMLSTIAHSEPTLYNIVETLGYVEGNQELQEQIVRLLAAIVDSYKESHGTLIRYATIKGILFAMSCNRRNQPLQQRGCHIIFTLVNLAYQLSAEDFFFKKINESLAIRVLTNAVGDYNSNQSIVRNGGRVAFSLKKRRDDAMRDKESATFKGLD